MLQSIRRRTFQVLALALTATLGVDAATAQSQLPTFVRTKVDAPLRNFQDRQGLAVTQSEAGTLLRVHGKSQGAYPFYEVSLPGGMPVWVYGQYLEKTDNDKVLRVNGNHVNQRPRPLAERTNTPLTTKLMANQQVLFIKRHDASKPWNEDWVQIWSPATTHAWVEASMTQPVTDVSGAQKEWQAGLRSMPKAGVAPAKAKAANAQAGESKGATQSAPTPGPVREEAIRSLRYSDALFKQAMADKDVSLDQLKKIESAYHKVLEMAPAGTHQREMALQQLEKLKLQMSVVELQEEMRMDKEAKAARMLQIQEEQRLEDLKRTASWGRFQSRGWVESEKIEGQVRYFLRWDGGRQTELVCGSGRYDLEFYKGFQVGVQGSTRRAAAEATLEAPATLRMIDISRLEVIAGSSVLR